jgi:hypothetical protein
MGWSYIIPSNHKLRTVLYTEVTKDPSGNLKLHRKDISNGSKTTWPEFRTAIALSLPKLKNLDSVSFENQIKIEPLDVKNPSIVSNFKPSQNNKRADMVNVLNEAFGLVIGLQSNIKEIRPETYLSKREHLLNLSAHVPILDGNSHEYSKWNEVPSNMKGFLHKNFDHPISGEKKRTQPDSTATQKESAPVSKKQKQTIAPSEDAMRVDAVVEEAPVAGPSTEPPALTFSYASLGKQIVDGSEVTLSHTEENVYTFRKRSYALKEDGTLLTRSKGAWVEAALGKELAGRLSEAIVNFRLKATS